MDDIVITKEDLEAHDGLLQLHKSRLGRRWLDKVTSTRKFRVECGSTVEVGLNREGRVIHQKSNHLYCKLGCVHCKNKIENVLKMLDNNPATQ